MICSDGELLIEWCCRSSCPAFYTRWWCND